jgi:hypothetical protein
MATAKYRKRIGPRNQAERALDAIVSQGGEVAFAAVNLATGEEQGSRADTVVIALGSEVKIAYSVVNDAGDNDTYRHEHPGDITNALIGRVLVEYWWPGEWRPEHAVHPSPCVDHVWAAAGL